MELPGIIMDPIGDIFGSVEGIAFGILSVIAIGGALERFTPSVLLIQCWPSSCASLQSQVYF